MLVIYIAGKRIFFFVYDVIVKQKSYKRPKLYYCPALRADGDELSVGLIFCWT